MRILVAEDDEANRKFITKLLSKFGEVDAVIDGIGAVKKFSTALEDKQPYDLVCLDVMMPRVDGYKALEAIRDYESKSGIVQSEGARIIMISALDEGGFDETLAADKYDCYMNKPIDIMEFEMKLKRMNLI